MLPHVDLSLFCLTVLSLISFAITLFKSHPSFTGILAAATARACFYHTIKNTLLSLSTFFSRHMVENSFSNISE